MSFSIPNVRENHFWRGFATFLSGALGVVGLVSGLASSESAATAASGILMGGALLGLSIYTFVVTSGWSNYETLPFPKKAACWLTVAIGWLFLIAFVLLFWLTIAVGKAMATAVERGIFLR